MTMAETPARQLVLSIHDVMPTTIERTEALVELLRTAGLDRVTLLVVPGKDWTPERLDRLRALLDAGAVAAGHGWTHHAATIGGLYHRLHSLLISRRAAEHLALDAGEIETLIRRCHDWFAEQALPMPELYVPPAWAMGPVRRDTLDRLPFARYETLTGVYDAPSGRFRRSPMIGFEADTGFRAASCRAWNALNARIAGRNRPLRVALHPYDLELRLADDLRRFIAAGGTALGYGVFADPSPEAAAPRAESQ